MRIFLFVLYRNLTLYLQRKLSVKMKTLLSYLFVLIPLLVFSQDEIFRVMSYNVENYFDCVDDTLTHDEEYLPGGIRGWNLNRYTQKQYNIARVICSLASWQPPALIGLMEVESRKAMLDLVRGSLKNLRYRFSHFESPDFRGIDVALLYDPAQFKLIHEEAISVRFPNNPRSTTRDILYVKGTAPTGDTLHVFVCHFPSRLGGELESEDKRVRAAAVLRQSVDSLFMLQDHANIIIMGDFNDHPNDISLADVLHAERSSEPFQSTCLYNLMYSFHDKGKGTHKHQAEWGVLDHLIVSGNLLQCENKLFTTPAHMYIHDPPFLLEEDMKFLGYKPRRTYIGMKYNEGFSDHLPIYVDFGMRRGEYCD